MNKTTPEVTVNVDWYPSRQEQIIFINHYAIKGSTIAPDIVTRNVGAKYYTLTTYDGKPVIEKIYV